MDLAEIRKKAKSRQDVGDRTTPSANAGRPAPSIQGVPGAREEAEPPQAQAAPAEVETPPDGGDPLEQLFSWNPELELATEASYLQGLDAPAVAPGDTRQMLTFSLGAEEYALDIEKIREIIKPREITDIPRVPPFVLGIVSLRGIIIPIFDLKQRLKLGSAENSAESRIVVCQHEERIVGLLVDRITQVVRLQNQSIEPPPNVLSGIDRDFVEGIGRYQSRMMILLQLGSVLNAELL